MQKCPQCARELARESFSPSHRERPGSWCKECRKAYSRRVRPPAPPRACEACETVIESPRHQQRFCSPACKARAQRTRARTGESAAAYAKLPPRTRAGKVFASECQRCGEPFEYTLVRRVRTLCELCRAHNVDWTKFRLTGREAEELRSAASCSICGGEYPGGRFGRWHVDHCHTSGRIRGVLCSPCNTALGLFGDSTASLARAIEYLREHERGMTKQL